MKNPKVTVLMAMYNGGQYLKSSLISVLNQTYRDFEFLIVNDCSTDNSKEIIFSLNDPKIVVFDNEKNIGQTKSLNVGLRIAKGEYIARVDADDIVFENWLEKVMSVIESNKNITAVSAQAFVIDHRNKIYKTNDIPIDYENIVLRSIYRSPVNHVGIVYKKDIVLEHGGYNDDYRLAADYNLWVRLLCSESKFEVVSEYLLAIREHPGSLSIVERNQSYVKEMVTTMMCSINHCSNNKLKYNDVLTIYQSFYEPMTITIEKIEEAVRIIDIFCDKINSNLIDDKSKIKSLKEYFIKTIFLKKIMCLIEQKYYVNISVVCDKVITNNYVDNKRIFKIILILSKFGKFLLIAVPFVYKIRLKIIAVAKYCRLQRKISCYVK